MYVLTASAGRLIGLCGGGVPKIQKQIEFNKFNQFHIWFSNEVTRKLRLNKFAFNYFFANLRVVVKGGCLDRMMRGRIGRLLRCLQNADNFLSRRREE